jgi:topoisomerase-4 subunit A
MKIISAIYVDGESKQYMVKRFIIETATVDKEFLFISEGIGSRLVVISTSDAPEVEVETVKGKNKEKVKEIINLDEFIDIKGWKALGNRLSQDKVVSVKLTEEPEDTGLEEDDDENELVEAPETKGKNAESSQGLKKKEDPNQWLEDGEQAALFAEPPKNQAPNYQGQKANPQKPKVKAEQQALFAGEAKQSQQNEKQKVKNETQKAESVKQKANEEKENDGKAFEVGDTIEFKF